jgi:pimeloyl-ACP methyl ester carboxylesterase
MKSLLHRRRNQRRAARELVIDSPAGIAEGRFVRAGGIDQWIQIRGHDRANPVLLIVSGSGLTMEPFTATLLEWERYFTVVLWDRRDVGRTRGRNGKAGHETWTFDLLADDGIEVIEFLRDRLDQAKVVLVGQSQGSIVGVTIARRRPDLLHAYVGTGQIADMARNEEATHAMALDRARADGNRRAARVLEQHQPPYRDWRSWIIKQRFSMETDPEVRAWRATAPASVLSWPTYRLGDVYRSFLGALFLPPRLFEGTMAATPPTLGTHFDVPVYFLHGQDDRHTLPSLAEDYLARIEAPAKAFVPLPGCGHLALLTRPDLFLAELRAKRVGGSSESLPPPTNLT